MSKHIAAVNRRSAASIHQRRLILDGNRVMQFSEGDSSARLRQRMPHRMQSKSGLKVQIQGVEDISYPIIAIRPLSDLHENELKGHKKSLCPRDLAAKSDSEKRSTIKNLIALRKVFIPTRPFIRVGASRERGVVSSTTSVRCGSTHARHLFVRPFGKRSAKASACLPRNSRILDGALYVIAAW